MAEELEIDILDYNGSHLAHGYNGDKCIFTDTYPDGYEYMPRIAAIEMIDGKIRLYPRSYTVVEVYPLHKSVKKPIIYDFMGDNAYNELKLSRRQLVEEYAKQWQKELLIIYKELISDQSPGSHD